MDTLDHRSQLATPAEVGAMAGIPVATLAQWRWRGIGPAYLKLGRHVWYDWSTVEVWLVAQTRNPS